MGVQVHERGEDASSFQVNAFINLHLCGWCDFAYLSTFNVDVAEDQVIIVSWPRNAAAPQHFNWHATI